MHRFPSLYQINTRVWLAELSRKLGRTAGLDDVPDRELDRLSELGFDWVWLLSVWETGPASRQVSLTNPDWRREFAETLPDLREDDIGGSGFAIAAYSVSRRLGGNVALARFRDRLNRRGLRLMLDFVPNHTALDHPWVNEHPEFYVPGTEADLVQQPRNFTRVSGPAGERILAHGRDPWFPGWPDTLQLNYGNPAVQDAMSDELARIAAQCDGLRCDMAMLLLPEVLERTWGIPARPFWPAAIARVRQFNPDFCFLAEVYWDLEWTIQQQGFDFAYDKRLYDRLREGRAGPVRDHLRAGLDYQQKLARFLENHDEPRATMAFPDAVHQAAAAITYLSPGLRFFHQGQLEGRTIRVSPHLARAPEEPVNEGIHQFYERLLAVLNRPVVRTGQWRLLEGRPAWDGNGTAEDVLVFAWELEGDRLLVIVNFADHHSQCLVPLPFPDLAGHSWRLADQFGPAVHERDGTDLLTRGLYLDLSPWQTSVLRLSRLPS